MKIEKCCGKGCQNRGEPQEGFDFFLCDDCAEELERCLEIEWLNKYVRYPRN